MSPDPGHPRPPPLLRVQGLAVRYGGIRALHSLDLEVGLGECVTLIGANGAGKSSTLRALAGMVAPAAGTIHLAGQDLTLVPAWERIGQGLCLVPEGRGVFPRLSIEDNLLLGGYHRKLQARALAPELEQVYTWFPRLAERRRQAAGTLSGGEQQMLALGRALLARPRLLLLDEPSMGLAPLMVDTIFAVIRQIAAAGVTLLLVEQNVHRALELCSHAYVLESGELALSAPATQCLDHPLVRAAYLG